MNYPFKTREGSEFSNRALFERRFSVCGIWLCALRKPDQIKCSFVLSRFSNLFICLLFLTARRWCFFTFYETCSNCKQRVVQMCASNLLSTQEIHSDWISVISFLFIVFVIRKVFLFHYCLLFIGEKINTADQDQMYSFLFWSGPNEPREPNYKCEVSVRLFGAHQGSDGSVHYSNQTH